MRSVTFKHERGLPVPRRFFVVLCLVAVGYGRSLLSAESGRDYFVLILGRRNVIPGVLAPDIRILCQKSGSPSLAIEPMIVSSTDLEPKGGFSAVTSCTDDAVFGIRADSLAAIYGLFLA